LKDLLKNKGLKRKLLKQRSRLRLLRKLESLRKRERQRRSV
jgi:hypothetical protein